MSTCRTCGAYYRITAFHQDYLNCEDCSHLVDTIVDVDSEYEIQSIINPSGKTAAHLNEDDGR